MALSACSSPEDRGDLIPYTKRPPETVPGIADFYASTFQDGTCAYGVLVLAREGRPIHVCGNDRDPEMKGKTSLQAIASILDLYDPQRVPQPLQAGEPKTWESALQAVKAALQKSIEQGREILLMTPPLISASRERLLQELQRTLPRVRHVAWDPLGDPGALRAAQALFGRPLKPRYRLDGARIIVSLHADFLGNMERWPEYAASFGAGRTVLERSDDMNRLYVLEGPLTLTGINADMRLAIRPTGIAAAGFAVARLLNEKYGKGLPPGLAAADLPTPGGPHTEFLEQLAKDLAGAADGSAVIMAGSEMPMEAHAAALLLNWMTGGLGTSVAMEPAQSASREGLADVAAALEQGRIGTAVLWDVNPCYASAEAERFGKALKKADFRVFLGLREDETSKSCDLLLPLNHWLESWGEFQEAGSRVVRLQQPIIDPLFDTRQAEDILLSLAREFGAKAPARYIELIKSRWKDEVLGGRAPDIERAWRAALHEGVLKVEGRQSELLPPLNADMLREAAATRRQNWQSLELVLHRDARVGDGRFAANGWLQELPEPVTKVSWGNTLRFGAADAAAAGVSTGDKVTVQTARGRVTATVLVQPGQAEGVLALALGYGRRAGAVAQGIGSDAYPLLPDDSGIIAGVSLQKTGRKGDIVRTQEHQRIGDKRHVDLELAQTLPLSSYRRSGKSERHESHGEHSLYPEYAYRDYKWGMAIDLTLCIGCSNCVIACQSENNVPVVGPEQVQRNREMHWLRIDRYYAVEHPELDVRLQPMLCQHCEKAPCENVCPVEATTHSADGLNEMTYNRCVGTRYCSNNCPYKVRRFNFFEFNRALEPPQTFMFNPEVTVRARGVMEKCTFCVQRIRDGQQKAKREGRLVADGEVQTACQAACPTGAIVFGNLRDLKSAAARRMKSERAYRVLAELDTQPSISYLARLRNKPEEAERT